MRFPVIKVCGIQSIAEAQAAASAGATAIGLLVGLTHTAEDEITPAQARAIVAASPPSLVTVLVTHLTDPAAVVGLAAEIGTPAVQIHGYMPPEAVTALRDALPQASLVKAIHLSRDPAHTAAETARAALVAIAAYAAAGLDAVVLDSRTATRLGGTGLTVDWDAAARVVQACHLPVILAGGLTPDSLAAALATVKPAGIDANSGLERADGSKDPAKLRAFVAAGRRGLRSTAPPPRSMQTEA